MKLNKDKTKLGRYRIQSGSVVLKGFDQANKFWEEVESHAVSQNFGAMENPLSVYRIDAGDCIVKVSGAQPVYDESGEPHYCFPISFWRKNDPS